MKSYRKELWFNVPSRMGFTNITPQVEQCLVESGVMEGLILVNAMHITASVFINDDERGLHHDYSIWLEKLAPHEPIRSYRHNDTGEDRLCRHLLRNLKWVQSDFRSKKLATRYAFGSPRRPASDWLALRAAPVLHNELDGLSGPFYFVSACATAADVDKTVGPRPPRGSSHFARPLPRPRLPVLLPRGSAARSSPLRPTRLVEVQGSGVNRGEEMGGHRDLR